MSNVPYVCSHCGRKFEAEERENIECPGCYWSSTVKKEEDVEATSPTEVPKPEKNPLGIKIPPLFFKVLGVFFILLLAFPFAGKVAQRFKEQMEYSRENRKKETVGKNRETVQSQNPLALLLPEEQAILDRILRVEAERPLSEEESSLLKVRVSLKTGISENLPSKVWSIENFKEMVKEQERFYKVPLPASYKGKLEKLFEEKYLTGEAAFQEGDLVKARNLWVEALAFPQYSKNVTRHRGVALTMIRPFINDTLSKIGAINNSLVEKNIREKERKLSESYADLTKLIDARGWQEASAQILELERLIQELENPALAAGVAPAYPEAISQVDEGIRATLTGLLTPALPAIADLLPLKQDLQAKRRVVESFQPGILEASQSRYQEALDRIREGDYNGAIKKLKEIETPLALAKDAQEKIKILSKLEKNKVES